MSKIIVPQELENKIIDLYVNKEYTRKKIKEELNLSFGDSVIKRILLEHNIEIRTNNGALKGGRKKMLVDEKIQQEIINLYNKGYGLNKIIEELNLSFSFDKVRSILQDNKIHIRNLAESAEIKIFEDTRKYQINDNYNFESHNGAYILGFLAADGYLPKTPGAKNRIVITLARKDEELLEKIKKELQQTGPIYQFMEGPNKEYPTSSLAFTSKTIREKVESYGIINNKTFQLNKLPSNLPKEQVIDFIAGFFDGDGSVFEKKDHGINMNLTCANYDFLKSVRDYLHINYKVRNVSIHSTERLNTIYYITYGKEDGLILGKAYYENDFIRLSRKKEKYFLLKEQNNKNRESHESKTS